VALRLPWGVALTYDDLQNLPEDGHRYELLDGALLVTPSPNHAHQRCVLSLAVVLRYAAPPDLEVIIAPFDWLIGPRTSFEPDILVARRADIGERNLPLPPVLAVEVVSPGDSSTEVHEKALDWLAAGARLVLVVHPRPRTITAHRSATDIQILHEADTLDAGDVVDGWRVGVGELLG